MALITGAGKAQKKPNPYVGEMKDKWAHLSPKAKQRVGLFGILLAVLVFGYILLAASGNTGPSTRGEARDGKVSNQLLPGENSRELGASSNAKAIEDLRADNRRLSELVERDKGLRDAAEGDALRGGQIRGREAQLMQRVDELNKRLTAFEAAGGQAASPQQQAQPMQAEAQASAPAGYGGIRLIQPDKPKEEPAKEQVAPASTDSSLRAVETSQVQNMYMPSGAMIIGTLITGLDAPTGRGSVKDPVPVLVRVKKEAILPNRFRADVRECFMLAAGAGDLASERAYLRAETISCVRYDKSIIDLKVQAYAVDSDGKAGLRGRLVSKQGAALGKAIIASFAEGVSQAFSGNNRINSRDGFNSDVYSQGMESGAVGGFSSALDRIAQYYLDLADAMHPVLEIDAGRPITFVMVKGQEMPAIR